MDKEKVLEEFSKKLIGDQQELDPDFNEVLNKMFWELIDNEPTKPRF